MLTLRKVDGSGAGFMLLVTDAENSQPSDEASSSLVSRRKRKLRQHACSFPNSE